MAKTNSLTPASIGGLPIQKVIEKPPTINVLIYAKPGTGKTVLSGSASMVPEMSPVLLVDIEGGTNSLRNTYPDVDTVRVTSWTELLEICDYLADENNHYKTVVFDSLSEIQKLNMYYNMRKAGKNPMEEKADWDDWGKNLESMRFFVRATRDLPINVIWTALLDESQDKKTGKTMKMPYFTGKFKQEIAAIPDEVFFYYLKEQYDDEADQETTIRVLLTASTDDTVAKDRSGQLPQVIVSPTMQTLYEQMIGN